MKAVRQVFFKLVNSLKYSIQGLIAVWRTEQSFRLEAYVGFVALIIIYFMPVILIMKLLMVVFFLLLLAVELLNSAIETIVDRISMDKHPLSKFAKDAGSASVAMLLLINVIVWLYAILLS